jgi:regulator of protease activity HflC (stomatin/prohibitin superfamily)
MGRQLSVRVHPTAQTTMRSVMGNSTAIKTFEERENITA